jgi:CRISPR-associated protein Csm5
MTDKLLNKTIKLTVLSPLFIGAGKEAVRSPYTDFVRKDNQIIIIDQPKFQAALAENLPLVDELVQEIKNRFDNNRSLFSLSDFITNRLKLTISDVEQCRLPVEGDIQTVPIRRFITSAGRAYIPGSTIKGAIRTAALLDWLLKKNAGKKQLAEIRMFLEKKELNALKRLDPAKECFGSISCDVFKYLRVSDSAIIDNTALSVREIKRVSIKEQRGNVQRRRSDIPMWSEALNSGTETICTVSMLKSASLTGFPFLDEQSVFGLLKIVNAQSRDSCEREIQALEVAPKDFDAFRRFYANLLESITQCGSNESIVRLGGGKTWFDNSIGLAIDHNDFGKEALFEEYLNLLDLGHSPFPSTRTAVMNNGQPTLPLGWVKLSVEG